MSLQVVMRKRRSAQPRADVDSSRPASRRTRRRRTTRIMQNYHNRMRFGRPQRGGRPTSRA